MLLPLVSHEGLVLDSRSLLRMQDYMNAAGFREIIDDFKIALEERLGDLEMPGLSAEKFDHVCHDILNLAGTLGLSQLRVAAERLSNLSTHDRLPIEHAAADVRNAGARALSALSDYINARNV